MFDDKVLARFWAKVRKSRGCWKWTACSLPTGYGQFGIAGKLHGAHRVSWAIANGRWPKDCVLHSCDVPGCVNPAHLSEGTKADNSAQMRDRGRARRADGERNSMAKLTDRQVCKIRLATGRVVDVAKRFGVSKWTIYNVKNGRNWGHIK